MLDLLMYIAFGIGFAIAMWVLVALINLAIIGVGIGLAHIFKRSD